MKKFKLFIIAGVILVASGLVGTIVANAQEPDKFRQKDYCITVDKLCSDGVTRTIGTACGADEEKAREQAKIMQDNHKC